MTADKEAIPNAELFLKKKISTYAWGTPFGLNKLPIVLYEEVAKVMDEYSSGLLKENEQWKAEAVRKQNLIEKIIQELASLQSSNEAKDREIAELKDTVQKLSDALASIMTPNQ